MADRFILTHVGRLPLFARLTPQQLEWVAEITQILRFEAGEVAYRQGTSPPGLIMFISGSASLTQTGTDGIERPFGQVKANEFINEASLFSEAPSALTLTMAEASIVLFVARQQMQVLLSYHPDIKANLSPTAPPPAAVVPQLKALKPVRDNEAVLLQIHRHWWSVAGRIVWIMLSFIALWVAYASFNATVPGVPWIIFALLGSVGLIVFAVYVYAEWRNDLFIITDRRIINIRQTIITFNKDINEVSLDSIHEISVVLPPLRDFIGRLVGYGTLVIKTSGDTQNMILNQVANPKDLQKKIFDQRKMLQEGLAQEEQKATRNAIKAEVSKFLSSDKGGAPGAPPTHISKPQGSGSGFLSTKFTNEKGETVYRKHYAVWTQHVFLPGAVTLAGLIILFINPIGILIMGLGAFLMYLADWDWRNDLYIVGDQTIIIIHKRPLFLQDEKDQFSLAQVDNIKTEVHGFFNTLLKIGDVQLLLTGTEAKNAKVFRQVHEPQQIQQEISRRQDRAQQAKRDSEAQRQRQAIVEYLSVYHETVQNSNGTTQGAPAPQFGTQNVSNTETPPRVRDGSRPPGVPRIQRDDGSPRPN